MKLKELRYQNLGRSFSFDYSRELDQATNCFHEHRGQAIYVKKMHNFSIAVKLLQELTNYKKLCWPERCQELSSWMADRLQLAVNMCSASRLIKYGAKTTNACIPFTLDIEIEA
jgi:hypothetical protein